MDQAFDKSPEKPSPVTVCGDLLQNVLEGTTDAVFVKDLEGRYLLINSAGASYIGHPVEHILGRTDAELWPPDIARQIMGHDRHVVTGGRRQAFEVEVRVGGEPRVFLSTKTPYRDPEGRILGVIGISRDITERKRTLEALRQSEERLARIVESAMDAIVTIDAQRTIRLFNTAAEEVFRCPASEAVGSRFDRFATPALRETLQRCARAFARRQVKKRYVWIPGGLAARRADGETFPIEATISQVPMAEETLFTIILRDVNERQEAEAQLRRLRLENLYLHEAVEAERGSDELVGNAPGMQAVHRAIEQVAPTDATVLVTGETGTGKELVARAIHARSARRDQPLVKVNCAALPAGLVESELFGHERGAFTGALARKVGRFELADGGTIFLDEIGDLPLEVQAKLLRVLQEGEFERVGGTRTFRVDVRVIAATNRDLEAAVRDQTFRADLFYRLNVFPIHIPPLRERRQDIPTLVHHFVLRFATNMGKRIDAIPKEALAALTAYDWPGNVRELQNVIERAVIISPPGRFELGAWQPARIEPPADAEPVSLEEVERRHILRVLEQTGWRVSGPAGAAVRLGLKPSTLTSRMKRLGIRRPT